MIAHVAQTVATVAPSVAPSVAPVVHATVVTPSTQSLNDLLNKLATLLAPYIVVISAALVSAVQYFLNKFPFFSHEVSAVQDLRRRLLAVVLPLLTTFLGGLATGQNTLHLMPWVFLVSQILYTSVKALQGVAQEKVVAMDSLAVDSPPAG